MSIKLTDREVMIVKLTARGLTDQEIADLTGLKHKTVVAHNHNMWSRIKEQRSSTGSNPRCSVVAEAILAGYVEVADLLAAPLEKTENGQSDLLEGIQGVEL